MSDLSFARPSGAPAALLAPRRNVYFVLHKALRHALCDTLIKLGCLDPDDTPEVALALDQSRDMLRLVGLALELEHRHVHAALPSGCCEMLAGGSTRLLAAERLRQAGERARRLAGAERAAGLACLYRQASDFVALCLQQMQRHEARGNQLLWTCHSDSDLGALETTMLAAVEPALLPLWLEWVMRALDPAGRLRVLERLRGSLSGAQFDAVLMMLDDMLPRAAHRAILRHYHDQRLRAA